MTITTTINDNRIHKQPIEPTIAFSKIPVGTAFEATHIGDDEDKPYVFLKLQGPIAGNPAYLLYNLTPESGNFGNRWSDCAAPSLIRGYKPLKLTISFAYEKEDV